ncbi:MAG: EscD/YscD/HrpQ family type III secretion system periplasmic domain-containing protein [Parvibaculaceae bacterium]|nr:EscD/YscD/HrpQ family type III secretion system periplasmic domain-containing protein [Parvibaculaceae bacterium]
MDGSWEILVIDGEQRGAKCALHSDRIRIGESDECDIILRSVEIHGRIFILNNANGHFTLFSEYDDPRDISPFQPFCIADITLCLGRGERWYLDPQLLNGTVNSITEDDGENFRGKNCDFRDVSDLVPERKRTMRILAGTSVIGGIICMVLVISANGYMDNVEASVSYPSAVTPLSLIQTHISDLGFGDRISARQTAKKSFLVEGTVQSDAQILSLKKEMEMKGIRTEFNLSSDEDIFRTVQEVASLYDADISVSILEPHVISLSGYIATRMRLNDMTDDIRSSVAGVSRIDDSRVITGDAVADLLADEIKAEGLEKNVHVSGDQKNLVVTGTPNDTERRIWQNIRSTYESRAGKNISFQVLFSPPQSEIPFSIRSITMGPIPSVMTSLGRRVMVGGALAPGFQLVSLNESSVKIRWRNEEFLQKLE